ncbi:MAG: hypothetical protein JRJ85_08640 [Deltaproteobacteria bacterium]|nr:hypothetical protein [Deltaproteobacteria bacterium]
MTTKISIIGAAGTLGSCAAFAIATQGLADELVMMDINENLLQVHVMDIETAVVGHRNMAVIAGREENLTGSDVVINATGAPYRFIESRMELLNDSLPIIQETTKKIARYCPEAVVITATNPLDTLNYAAYRVSGMDRKKLLGYSLNDSLRFRMLSAGALKVEHTKVEGLVIGEHGDHLVQVFSSLRIDGKPISVDEPFKQRIREEMPKILQRYEGLRTGRTAGWTTAMGLAAMVSSIVRDAGEVFPCSVNLAGEFGFDDVSASVPAKLGKDGVQEIIELDLTSEERQQFEGTVAFLKESAVTAREML